jgi:gas vesicle protein
MTLLDAALSGTDLLKALSKTMTQLFIAISAFLGLITVVIKHLIDRHKKADDLKDLINKMAESMEKSVSDLKKEINDNEELFEKRFRDMEQNHDRYFSEIRTLYERGQWEKIQEVLYRYVQDQHNKDFKP